MKKKKVNQFRENRETENNKTGKKSSFVYPGKAEFNSSSPYNMQILGKAHSLTWVQETQPAGKAVTDFLHAYILCIW